MALTDQQADAQIAQIIASYSERILIAQLSATTLGVQLALTVDPAQRQGLAQQILAQQRDIDVLTAAAAELGKISGKPNSVATTAAAAAKAVAAARGVAGVVVGP